MRCNNKWMLVLYYFNRGCAPVQWSHRNKHHSEACVDRWTFLFECEHHKHHMILRLLFLFPPCVGNLIVSISESNMAKVGTGCCQSLSADTRGENLLRCLGTVEWKMEAVLSCTRGMLESDSDMTKGDSHWYTDIRHALPMTDYFHLNQKKKENQHVCKFVCHSEWQYKEHVS